MKPRTAQHAGRYSIREIRDASPQDWDEWVENSPGGGHVLQSHAWGEFKRSQGWRPLRLLLERDGEAVGTGQFLLYNTFPIPGRLMYCAKGPWLPWDDAHAVRAFFDGASRIARREGAHTVKIEPEVLKERGDVEEHLRMLGFRDARYDLNFSTTVVNDLSPSEDEIFANMTGTKGRTTRKNIRVGIEKGVDFFEPEDFEWAFDTLFRWIEGLAKRKEGFANRRPRGYLHEMMRRMSEAGQGHFFFVRHEGEPLSAIYAFTFGGKVWFMHGASVPDTRKLRPNYPLMWEVIRWGKRNGITYCDWVGAPKREDRTEDNPYYGAYEYKRGFGGETVEFLGCMDLAVKPRLAAAWHSVEPLYYRAYYKLKNNVFY